MKYFVKINSIAKLYEISRAMRKLDIEAYAYQGKSNINMNSILGIFTLDWSQGVTIEFTDFSSDEQTLMTILYSLDETEISKID